MLTRQGQGRSPTEMDVRAVDDALQDAGMLEANMSFQEKQELYSVLQESKLKQVQDETERLSLNSHCPSLQRNVDLNQSVPEPSSSRDSPEIDISSSPLKSRENSECVFPDTVKSSSQESHADQQLSSADISISKETRFIEEKSPGPNGGPGRRSLTERNIGGRGRAVPTKFTKYPPLPLSSPGQNQVSSPRNFPPSPQSHLASSLNQSTSPMLSSRPKDFPPSPQTDPRSPQVHKSRLQAQPLSSPNSSSSPDIMRGESPERLKQTYVGEENLEVEDKNSKEGLSNEVDLLDVEPLSQDEQPQQNVVDPGSPVSVEDVAEDDDKEPLQTIHIGKSSALVSPLETLAKPFQGNHTFPWFEELQKFKGNKSEWLMHAKKTVQQQRYAYLDKLLLENPLWGAPVILDGGYNKKTLFKPTAPKYSSLFGNSSEKQGETSTLMERQSKTQASARIQEIINDDLKEPEFHSLRRSRPKGIKKEDQVEIKPSNPWNSKSDPGTDDDVQCIENSAEDVGEGWRSVRNEQRRKVVGVSDSEDSPDIRGCHDTYEFHDEEDDDHGGFAERWNTAPNRNKKNQKRDSKALHGSVEVEGKTMPRPRGSGNQRARSTKLRLQKGALSRPSEHAGSSNINSRRRGSSPEHVEGDNATHSNAHHENRDWSNKDNTETENIEAIGARKFYNQKGIHPRNNPSPQTRRNSRENRRSNDYPSLPGSSSSSHGRQHDEAAVIETTPCPICGKGFPRSEIEVHAGECFNFFDGSAVGDDPVVEDDNGGGSDKTVGTVVEKAANESSEAAVTVKCPKCEDQFALDELKDHMKFCGEIFLPSSLSGQKRAGSVEVEDGPAKKTSRLTE